MGQRLCREKGGGGELVPFLASQEASAAPALSSFFLPCALTQLHTELLPVGRILSGRGQHSSVEPGLNRNSGHDAFYHNYHKITAKCDSFVVILQKLNCRSFALLTATNYDMTGMTMENEYPVQHKIINVSSSGAPGGSTRPRDHRSCRNCITTAKKGITR